MGVGAALWLWPKQPARRDDAATSAAEIAKDRTDERETITIGTVRGQRSCYENAENVRERNVRIGTFVEEPDRENKTR